MRAIKMVDRIDQRRRRFLGTAALAAATQLGMVGPGGTIQQREHGGSREEAGTQTSFGSLKQIDAGVLNVGYAEAAPLMAPRFSFCTAGLTTSTAMSMSPRCWRQQVIGRSSRICADTAPRAFSRATRSATASRQPLRSTSLPSWMRSRSRRPSLPAMIGARARPTSSRRSGRSAAKRSSP